MIQITEQLAIPEQELTFTASRSGGPGGQKVNKVSTRVTLSFDVNSSPSLSQKEKSIIRSRLSNRIGRDGVLQVASQKHRSQSANKRAATRRFAELLSSALKKRKLRIKTRMPGSARQRRLEEKERRGELKRSRSKVPF